MKFIQGEASWHVAGCGTARRREIAPPRQTTGFRTLALRDVRETNNESRKSKMWKPAILILCRESGTQQDLGLARQTAWPQRHSKLAVDNNPVSSYV